VKLHLSQRYCFGWVEVAMNSHLALMRPVSIVVMVASLSSVTAVAAHAQEFLPPTGGGGGEQFVAMCPAGQNLTGLELRAGTDVDAVRPVCVMSYGPDEISAPVLTSGSGLMPEGVGILGVFKVVPGWYGGPGGGIVRVLCPATTPIVIRMDVAAEAAPTMVVNNVHLFCGHAATTQTPAANPSAIFDARNEWVLAGQLASGTTSVTTDAEYGSQRCPRGQVGIGVHGRSGKYLDAIGLICHAPRLTNRPGPPAIKAGGRVNLDGPSGPPIPICETARLARERNSPAAAGLEERCQRSLPVVAPGGRVKLPDTSGGAPNPICDTARAARERNSPAAAGLAEQCLAAGGSVSGDATAPPSKEALADRGEYLSAQNPLAFELRNRQTDPDNARGFQIGMAASEGQTLWGPGKQKMLDSLNAREQEGFRVAVSFALDRNRNIDFATVGLAIAEADPVVAEVRARDSDVRYWLGFDIASGIFGDPALGARGNTATGPGSLAIRDALSAPAQRGFDSSVKLHLNRRY